MYKSSTEIKVGLFVLIAILVLAWMAVRLGGFRLGPKEAYTVSAVFPDASGLKPGVAVEVAGIQVGNVTGIDLYGDHQARVTMAIQVGILIPADSVAGIRAKGILGDKYIELLPAVRTAATEDLEDGGALTNTTVSADMTELMAKLGTVADDLKSLTGALAADGGGAQLRQIVDNFKDMSERLDNIIKNNEAGLTETLASLNKTMTNLENITNKVNAGEGTLGGLINSNDTLLELNSALTEIRQVAGKINSGEGTIGRLVNDETTIDKIDQALTGINNYIEKDDKFKVFVDYQIAYMTRYDYLKNTLNIRLQPAPDRYYLLGVTGDYFGEYTRHDYSTTVDGVSRSWIDEDRERGKLKFNAQIARRYYDLVLRGGLIESGAGLGADYYLMDDALKLTFEAFSADFDHPPHLRLAADYNLWKIFWLTVGVDDFISDQHRYSPYFGLGIRFSDDDLKYLLSGAGALLP